MIRQAYEAISLAFRASAWRMTFYSGLVVVGGAVPVVNAWLIKMVLDEIVNAKASGPVILAASVLVITGLFLSVSPHAVNYLRTELERRVRLAAQEQLFAAVNRFTGLRRFEDPKFLDQLRLAKQSGQNSPHQAADGILGSLRALVTIGGFLGSLLVLSPVMAIVVLASGVPVILAEISLSRRRARMLWSVGPMERREIFYSQLLTSVEAAKEVRLFGTGSFLLGRMQQERREANRCQQRVDRRQLSVQSRLVLVGALVSGAGLLWAVRAATLGTLSVGDITVLVAALGGVQAALTQLASQVAKAHQALTLFKHYLDVLVMGPDIPEPAQPRDVPPLRYGVEFKDVWFRYSDDHPWILRGVNLTVNAGEELALVGLNGAGKSTLVKLMCRFYDPTYGAITWDGIDIREFDVDDLRARMGGLFQDYMHYDLTAKENIALGELEALGDVQRIENSARRAGIHDRIVSLPQGYDTLLTRVFAVDSKRDEERTGVVLSGGQAQRLALARAFLRDQRDLFILDEPSSGLDAESENEIHVELRRHRGHRTTLLISHRLGSARGADHIAVLSKGRVVEEGTHDSLVRTEGPYARLFRLQASGYQEDMPNKVAEVDFR